MQHINEKYANMNVKYVKYVGIGFQIFSIKRYEYKILKILSYINFVPKIHM